MNWPDWKLVLIAVIALLAVTLRWWLLPVLKALQDWDIKAQWKDKGYGIRVARLNERAAELAPPPAVLRNSQITSLSYRIAVLNQSTVVLDGEAEAAVAALQKQVSRDLAPVWSVDAQLSLLPAGSQPPQNSWLLLILDDTDQPWEPLAYRDLTKEGLPLVKVFPRSAQAVARRWTVLASHQILELLLNPRFNLTVYMRTAESKLLYSYEICNPCDTDEYGYKIGETLVSDFVYPAWFQPSLQPNSTQFDYCGHISAPLQILPGSHVNRLEIRSQWQKVSPEPPARRRKRRAEAQ